MCALTARVQSVSGSAGQFEPNSSHWLEHYDIDSPLLGLCTAVPIPLRLKILTECLQNRLAEKSRRAKG